MCVYITAFVSECKGEIWKLMDRNGGKDVDAKRVYGMVCQGFGLLPFVRTNFVVLLK